VCISIAAIAMIALLKSSCRARHDANFNLLGLRLGLRLPCAVTGALCKTIFSFSVEYCMSQSSGSGRLPLTRREFAAGTMAVGAVAVAEGAAAQEGGESPLLGPIVGPVDATSAMIWMRGGTAGSYVLEVTPASGGEAVRISASAEEKNDLCLHWKISGLRPATKYTYRVVKQNQPVAENAEQSFVTAPNTDLPTRVRLAVSSCAREDEGSRAVWQRMAAEKSDAVLLIGDVPYIDSTKLDRQTKRHREFAAVPEYQRLLSSRPCWWTWDDHDFAGNDTDGRAVGKENSRLAYTRYRPQQSYGDGSGGIYTSFRYGPVEVFILDTRWFSQTEPSFADPTKPTLLGKTQWEWLQSGLKASRAPFKLLACGMIWDDKENREKDDWGTYQYERVALEQFIAMEQIYGVILVGGDIHASRVLRYKTKKTIGYELLQFIASPIHANVIPSLNVYHPDLVRSAVEPHVFLLMDFDSTVTPARLQASLINRHGARVFTYDLTVDDLTAR
jgi:alkaline phosphatase D